MNKKELQVEIKVDTYNLQEEWARQPVLFLKYSLKMSKLIHQKDLLRSELASKVIKKGEKISEAALNREVDGNEELIDLQYEINMYKNAVAAFEHKKKALEYEAQLLIGGFFSEPSNKKPFKKEGA